jgi:hypothetical protein
VPGYRVFVCAASADKANGLDHGIPERLLQRNGRWKSQVAFEGYIEDEMGLRLFVQEYSNARHRARVEPATQAEDEQ